MVVGLMLGTMLGFSALSIDIGLLRVAQSQLQAAIDAATVSGAGELDGSLEGITRAKARAVAIAGMNTVLGQGVSVPLSAVQVGTWDDDQVFEPWNGVDDPKTVNAVFIDHAPAPIGSVLAGVAFQQATLAIRANAIAIRPFGAGTARTSECYLPLAIPDCWLNGLPPGQNPPPLKFTFSPTPTDAIAWGSPVANPSTDMVRNQFADQCGSDTDLEVGDPMYVNEGLHTSGLTELAQILNGNHSVEPTQWDSSLYGPQPPRTGSPDTANLPFPKSSVKNPNWGNTFEGPVALIDAGPDCSAVSFTGALEITGIAWAVIYDLDAVNIDKNIYVQLDVVNEHEIWGEVDEDLEGNVLATGEPTLVNGG